VIGPAVNLASRIEGLTKRLLRPLLTSAAFAKSARAP
jgi:class 3 adenylate cyclase